ncbi:MAG: cysteine desulfurase family protein [Acidobacteriota bacterium]
MFVQRGFQQDSRTHHEEIYLDNAATTALDPRVLEAMAPYLGSRCGDPSGAHAPGRRARQVVERGRVTVARHLHCATAEVVFTSGGTESNNLALIGSARLLKRRGRHLVVSSIEHPSVLRAAAYLETQGFSVTCADADSQGRVGVDAVRHALRPDTVLVSVMLASHVTGIVQPVPEIARLVHAHEALLHTDAVQALGKTTVDVRALGADLVSLSAHKMHGPQGIGGLYVRAGAVIQPRQFGDGQERGLRGGTENIAGILGFVRALDLCGPGRDRDRMGRLRDMLQDEITSRIDAVIVHGREVARLSSILAVTIPDVNGEALHRGLAARGLAVSSGEPGAAGRRAMVRAVGSHPEPIASTIRFSLSRRTTPEEIHAAAAIVGDVVARLHRPATASPARNVVIGSG